MGGEEHVYFLLLVQDVLKISLILSSFSTHEKKREDHSIKLTGNKKILPLVKSGILKNSEKDDATIEKLPFLVTEFLTDENLIGYPFTTIIHQESISQKEKDDEKKEVEINS